jgi:hypothetical protein
MQSERHDYWTIKAAFGAALRSVCFSRWLRENAKYTKAYGPIIDLAVQHLILAAIEAFEQWDNDDRAHMESIAH